MSFLALDDHAETLAAALAFLDEFDASAEGSQSRDSASVQAPRNRVRKRRAGDELLLLRGQVTELQARLTHLKRFCAGASHSSVKLASTPTHTVGAATTGAKSIWFKRAASEYKQLECARKRNLELRGALEEQQKASGALEQLLQLQLTPEDAAFLEEVEAQQNNSTVADDLQFARLRAYVEVMYASTSTILAQVSIRSTRDLAATSRNQVDPVLGRPLEFKANVPMPHSFRVVEQFVWRQLMMNFLFECGKPEHKRVHSPEANCFAKRHNLVLSEGQERRRARGFAVVRKFAEARRTVIALSSRFQISGTSVLFRKTEFIVVTDLMQERSSSSDSESTTSSTSPASSLVQTYARVHTESEDAKLQPLTREVERLRDVLLEFAGKTLKPYKHRLLQTLLDAGGVEFSEQRHRDLCLGCFACNLQQSNSLPVTMDATPMLLLEHDAPATLAAALALVDSCATDASSTGSNSSSGGDSPPAARRVRKPNTAVLAELRAQVATLSERLLELQERRAGLPPFRAADGASASARRRRVTAKGSGQELEAAMRELRRLQEAKKRNAALKVAWRTQSMLARELRAIMIKQVAISQSSDALLESARAKQASVFTWRHNASTVVKDPTRYLSELDASLAALYRQTAVITACINLRDTSRPFSVSHVHQDHVSGSRMFEFVASTQIACTMEDISVHFWGKKQCNWKKIRCVQLEGLDLLDPHQHKFTQSVDCKFGAVDMDVTLGVCRVVEPGRVVKLFSSLLALEETDIRFRENAWMTLEAGRSSTDAPMVTIKMCYRLSPELPSRPRAATAQANAAYFEDLIFQTQSKRMQDVLLQRQAMLVDTFGLAL